METRVQVQTFRNQDMAGSLPGISHGFPLTGTTDVTLTLKGLLFLSMVFCSCLLSLGVSRFFFLY